MVSIYNDGTVTVEKLYVILMDLRFPHTIRANPFFWVLQRRKV
jgi:hypothetical protein